MVVVVAVAVAVLSSGGGGGRSSSGSTLSRGKAGTPALHAVAASAAYGYRHAAAASGRQPGAALVARLGHEHLRALHDEGRLDELPHRPVGDGGMPDTKYYQRLVLPNTK